MDKKHVVSQCIRKNKKGNDKSSDIFGDMEIVKQLFERHGIYEISMKKGFYTAIVRIHHPQLQVILHAHALLGCGYVGRGKSKREADGYLYWLNFENLNVTRALEKVLDGLVVNRARADYVLALNERIALQKREGMKRGVPLSASEINVRHKFMEDIKGSPMQPRDIRYTHFDYVLTKTYLVPAKFGAVRS